MTLEPSPAPSPALIPAFHAVRRQARVLPANHPSVAKAVATLHERIQKVLQNTPTLTLSIIGEELYLDGHLLAEESIAYAGLVRELLERKLDSIVFTQGISADELARFIAMTNLRPQDIEAGGGWDVLLRREGLAHLGTHRVAGLEQIAEVAKINSKIPVDMYKLGIQSITAAFQEVRQGHTFDVDVVQYHVKMLLTALLEDPDAFHHLSTIKNKDEYTFYHSINVSVLSLMMGFRLRLDPVLLEMIGTAAMLHDVGKMCVPLEVLNKPGGFTPEEWTIMQSHAVEGAKLLMELPEAMAVPVLVATQHHAGHAFSGYPSLPGVSRLHLLAELVSVADVFDALTSDRPYRQAMPSDQAMKIIVNSSGKQLHPVIVKVFAQMSGMFPVGTLVELDSGDVATVLRPNPDDIFRPVVRVIRAASGGQPDDAEVEVKERDADGRYLRTIVRSIDPKKLAREQSPA